MLGTRDNRRHERYPIQIAVRLFVGQQALELRTNDVSFSGLFLRTDAPPKLRRLVRVEATLPDGTHFAAHGMAVHVVEPGDSDGHVPGVGVQFYALDPKLAEIWNAFIREVKRAMRNDDAELQRLASPSTLDPIRRRYPRHKVPLEVRFRSFDELYHSYARDVSRGGLFVATDQDLPVGSEVILTLVRPGSHAFFEVDGVVRRRIADNGHSGVGIEFINLTKARQEELHRFIIDSVPTMEELRLVEAGDPRLA